MKKKLSVKAILLPTLSLFIICAVVTALLALTNNITAEKIAENEAQSKQESMFAVVPEAKSFDAFTFNSTPDELASSEIYTAKDGSGNTVGYAISTAAQGYGGQVKVMTGIDTKGVIISVDVFYNDDETPGLGKNTSNESFRGQYTGLSADKEIFVSKDTSDAAAQTVDAVTSATISSRAVTTAVNKACEIYTKYIAKEAE